MTTPTVVLITGANSGIGYEAVKTFLNASKAYHILACARTAEKAHSAVEAIRKECPGVKNTVEPLTVDVSSDDSIEAAYKQVCQSPGRLDVLINNAGASFDVEYTKGRVSLRDCFNKTYDVNVTGANVMSHVFMPLLLKSPDARLLFVAGLSMITEFDKGNTFPSQPQPAGWPKKHPKFETIAYRTSKVALNMLTLDWAFRMKEDPIKIWGVAPGFLATNLGGAPEIQISMNAGHPSIGGKVYLSVVEGERDADAGKVIRATGFLPL